MIATISKEFAFSASHQLDGLPDDHQCARLHGHNYVARLTIEGEVREPGFVVDYGELAPIKDWIDETLDHRHLNDVFDFNPTAENMAGHLADRAADLLASAGYDNVTRVAVSLSETPKTWATVDAQQEHLPYRIDTWGGETLTEDDRYRWGTGR